jgi:hypothetical protein
VSCELASNQLLAGQYRSTGELVALKIKFLQEKAVEATMQKEEKREKPAQARGTGRLHFKRRYVLVSSTYL